MLHISDRELNEKANQLAHYLISEHNIRPDDLAALCFDRSEYIIIVILAVLKAGGAYVPIDTELPKDRIAFVLKDTNAKVLLIDNKNYRKLKSTISQCSIDFLLISKITWYTKLRLLSNTNPQTKTCANNLAYVIYTSGTTGQPKGVMIEHGAVVNLCYDLTKRYSLSKNEVILQFASYAFDASVEQIVLALLNGYTLLLFHNKLWLDTQQFTAYLIKNHVTHLHATPSLLQQLSFTGINTLRRVVSGGEELKTGLINKLKNFSNYIKIINEFGPTETTITSIVNTEESNHIGKAISNTLYYILDKNLKPLPIGAIGELHIGGIGLARGYLNLPELTTEKFISNPFQTEKEKALKINNRIYKTGDLVRLLPDGNLEFIGRNDSQIKIRGYRIELGEIEKNLLSYPEVKQAIVLFKEKNCADNGEISDKYLVAYYVADKKLNPHQIQKFLKMRLSEYMIPSILIHLDKFPITTNGKLDKKALPKPDFTKNRNYIAPINEQERMICNAFSKILDIEEISIDDDFFTLGCNSIQAIQLIASLQSNFDLKVSDIFDLHTPRKLDEVSYFGKDVLKNRLEKIKLLYKNKKLKKETIDERIEKQIQEKLKLYHKSFENMCIDYSLTKPIKNILLSGATGYLGCNLLNELIKYTNYNIYLLVRAESKHAAIERVNQKFKYYFEKTLDDVLDKRVFIIKSNLEKIYLDLTLPEYYALRSRIDSVIHAAALVKHYGEYEKFYAANVQTTINLLKFAKGARSKDFHYISTYPVLNYGFIPKPGDYVYTEDNIPANLESWQNVYIKTKLQGEHEVIKYRDYGMQTNIYSVGNMAFNSENYRAQEN